MSDFIVDRISVGSSHVDINKPNKCPCCHIVINAPVVAISGLSAEYNFAVLFVCPSCKRYFFKSYNFYSENGYGYKTKDFDSTPTLDLNLNIPEEVEKISPKFVEIYTQALTAEFHGLSEITGIGLRKAIEFLVKDYLINYKKQNSDTIKKMFLNKAIDSIDNSKIKNLARATTWIGNDETHYERIHKDKDIKDMKKFIQALIHFISFEFVSDEAEDFTVSSMAK